MVRYMEKELYNNRLHDNVHEQQMNKSKCPNKLPLFIWEQTALLALSLFVHTHSDLGCMRHKGGREDKHTNVRHC